VSAGGAARSERSEGPCARWAAPACVHTYMCICIYARTELRRQRGTSKVLGMWARVRWSGGGYACVMYDEHSACTRVAGRRPWPYRVRCVYTQRGVYGRCAQAPRYGVGMRVCVPRSKSVVPAGSRVGPAAPGRVYTVH
jgi:hypothetical protein